MIMTTLLAKDKENKFTKNEDILTKNNEDYSPKLKKT